MSASLAVAIVVITATTTATAQDHVALYNEATTHEAAALAAEDGVRQAALGRCMDLAMQSFTLEHSRLAAWRVLSCAAAAGETLTAWLAALAFDELEPGGIDGWTHASFAADEVARVHAQAARLRTAVGGVRITDLHGEERWVVAGREVASPMVVTPGSIRRVSGPFVSVGDVVYAEAGRRVQIARRTYGLHDGFDVVDVIFDANTTADPPRLTVTPRVPPRAPGPETPSREDVQRALAALAPLLSECGGGMHGRAQVGVVLEGVTGRVRSVSVAGEYAGTPVGSCIARAVRESMVVSPFTRSTFSVNAPMSF